MDGFVKFYADTTRKMIQDWSYTIPGVPGTRVDIVRNVINLVSVHWVAYYLVSHRSVFHCEVLMQPV